MSDTRFRIGDRVRVKATGNIGKVIDVKRATNDRFSPLIPYIEYTNIENNVYMPVIDANGNLEDELQCWDVSGVDGCKWDWFLDDDELELL